MCGTKHVFCYFGLHQGFGFLHLGALYVSVCVSPSRLRVVTGREGPLRLSALRTTPRLDLPCESFRKDLPSTKSTLDFLFIPT